MRGRKRLVLATIFTSLLAFAGLWLFRLYSQEFLYDISLAVFGSALVGFIISLLEYLAEKRRAMETFYAEAFAAASIIGNAKYYTKKDLDEKELKACIDSYISIADFDLRDLNNAYGGLDFIFLNRSVRKNAYNDIYEKITEKREEARLKAGLFRLVLREGSLGTCYRSVLEMNDNWFKAVHGSKGSFQVYHQTRDDLLDSIEIFRSKIYGVRPVIEGKTPVYGMLVLKEE